MIAIQDAKVLFVCDYCDRRIKDGELLFTGDLDIMRQIDTLLDKVSTVLDQDQHICSLHCLYKLLSLVEDQYYELTLASG